MLFTSILFIIIFLPAFLLAYYLSPPAQRNAVAVLFSIGFYFWGAPRFVPVVLLLGAFNFGVSHVIQTSARRTAWVAFACALHVAVLFYYKYLGFFGREVLELTRSFGVEFQIPEIALPLGVSFITFEQISYLVDVYRGDAKPARSVADYWLFLLLFPHSIAGPIFRWRDLDVQIRERTLDDERIWRGFVRFAYGLAKKALLANAVAHLADAVFALPSRELGFDVAWLGALAYTLQIYLDFSAYSDMAIGLGHMIGFSFKENFEFPYHARSITEFWKRWHISLTSWFRLYVYIPLGGNRFGTARTLANVLAVFVISGLWHGASWTFVIWGLYHGLLIVLERVTKRELGLAPSFLLVVFGWIFFRATDLGHAASYLAALFGLHGNPDIVSKPIARVLPYRALIAGLLGVGLVAVEPRLYAVLRTARLRWVAGGAVVAATFAMAALANSSYNPFIYFRF